MKLKNIRIKLNLLILIVLTSFVLQSNTFGFTTNDPYCEDDSKFFAGKYEIGYPEEINFNVSKSAKWFQRLLKAMVSKDGRIDKSLKKFQNAEIILKYKNNITCKLNAQIRIHGGGNDHIDKTKLTSSIRVKITNGHIGHKYNFALIMERNENVVGRDGPEEIFASTLFEEFGFLSPLHFRTKVSINSEILSDYIFVEMPSNEMAKDSGRNNGIFLAGNKNNFTKLKYLGNVRGSIALGRIKNSDAISEKNKNVLLYSLDKLNYIHINSLGIGDGKDCCGSILLEDDIIKKEYLMGDINLRLNPYLDKKSIRTNSIFNLLLNATNAHHGQSMEDRVFFYNPTYATLEPVYNDADSNILNEESLLYSRIFKSEKKYIEDTKNTLDKIDIDYFKLKLKKRGLEIDKAKLKRVFKKISDNLDLINKSRVLNEYEPKYSKNYFNKHHYKKLPFYLAFGGKNNNFEICNIDLSKCSFREFSNLEYYSLLKDKYITLDDYDKEIIYVRFSKELYLNNSSPFTPNINNFNFIKFKNEFKIHYNSTKKNISIDEEKKIINLKQNFDNERFIFTGKNIEGWKIYFKGINNNAETRYKRDEYMIGGCVTFLDTYFNNISINLENSKCPKSIEILNSSGNFEDIYIKNSSGDGFDAEFSNINTKKIIVENTKGECIGVKRGIYKFNKLNLSFCYDKAISTGEHAKTTIKDIYVSNSTSGIVSKDTSLVELLDNYKIENSKHCFRAYRGKYNFYGSIINIKTKNIFCNDSIIEIDKNSLINYF